MKLEIPQLVLNGGTYKEGHIRTLKKKKKRLEQLARQLITFVKFSVSHLRERGFEPLSRDS